MTTHTLTFTSSLGAGEVIDRFEALSKAKGWKINKREEHRAEAKQKISFKSWGEHIDVTSEESSEGSTVHLVVNAPQLIDWGEGSEIEQELKLQLGG